LFLCHIFTQLVQDNYFLTFLLSHISDEQKNQHDYKKIYNNENREKTNIFNMFFLIFNDAGKSSIETIITFEDNRKSLFFNFVDSGKPTFISLLCITFIQQLIFALSHLFKKKIF
jgi:hypothetical protein